MPSDVEEAPQAKDWNNGNNKVDWWSGPIWRTVKAIAGHGLRSLSVWPSRSGSSPPDKKLRPTAYLDGLRGFAAFIVYWHHHELWAHPTQKKYIESGFGHEGQEYFIAYPGIRNFFGGGHYAVSVFFVISGYVLSAKPLALIHAGEQAKLADNLSSALFRRWLRLYIPIICTTFLYMLSWHIFGPLFVDGQTPKPTIGEELWNWYTEMKGFSFVWREGGNYWISYNFHLWTIPLEFKGSIVIYTSLLAFSRCRRNARLLLQVALIIYFLYIADGWHSATFIVGMLLCDLHLLAAKDDLPDFFAQLEPFKKIIFYQLLFFSFYLGGVPAHTNEILDLRASRGWYFLSFIKPNAVFNAKWFYLFWAAIFLVASPPHAPWLKRFFETRFCQFLGRISYALYLVHGPILSTIADRLYTATGMFGNDRLLKLPGWTNAFPLSTTGPLGLEMAFLVPHLILLPLTLYTAEIVTRLFDEPSVTFPLWLYKATMGRPSNAAVNLAR